MSAQNDEPRLSVVRPLQWGAVHRDADEVVAEQGLRARIHADATGTVAHALPQPRQPTSCDCQTDRQSLRLEEGGCSRCFT